MNVNEQRPVSIHLPIDTDGYAPLNFEWGSIRWLCNDEMYPSTHITFGYVQIKPTAKNPRHYHPNCDEVLFLIEGELEHSLGDATYRLTPGMSIYIPVGIEHDAVNLTGDTARMVVAYSTGERQTVMCEEGEE